MWTVRVNGRETGSMEEKEKLREISYEEEGAMEERVREGLIWKRDWLSEADIGRERERERGGLDGRGEGV